MNDDESCSCVGSASRVDGNSGVVHLLFCWSCMRSGGRRKGLEADRPAPLLRPASRPSAAANLSKKSDSEASDAVGVQGGELRGEELHTEVPQGEELQCTESSKGSALP